MSGLAKMENRGDPTDRARSPGGGKADRSDVW